MIFGLMKKGWARRPAVPDPIYLRALDEALLLVAEYDEMDSLFFRLGFTNESDLTDSSVRELFSVALEQFNPSSM